MMENPAGLQPRELFEKIQADEVPRDFLTLVARGFLPIPQSDLIAMLAILVRHEDAAISGHARESLEEVPRGGLLSFARDEDAPPTALAALLEQSDDHEIRGALVRNRATPNSAISAVSRTAPPRLQEVIVTNQRRIIEDPGILDALLENPDLSGDVKRRVHEAREEFIDKVASREAKRAAEEELVEEELAEEDARALAELLEKAEAEPEEEAVAGEPPADLPEQEKSIWIQILQMGVSDRVKLAFRGGRTERTILIRDRNKLVCSAVIKSPRITESEVEGFALMRNIETEVLRQIGMKREWMRKYPIVLNLVKNPKTPIGVVLPLINRLNLRDLKNLSQDRNVPEAVRISARKLFVNRTKH